MAGQSKKPCLMNEAQDYKYVRVCIQCQTIYDPARRNRFNDFHCRKCAESTPPIGRGQILRLNDVMKDISLNQGRELAARRITQGSPGFILQTVKDLIDYLITCVRGNPEWPGLLRGK